MAKFTLSQLDVKPTDYTVVETDLLLTTIGTATPFLSSVKVSTLQLGSYFSSISAGWKHGATAGEIYHNAGNVGIGVANPATILDIASANGPSIQITDTTNSVIGSLSADDHKVVVGASSNHKIGLVSNNTVVMTLSTNGHVGIGTSTPNGNAILDVTSTTKAFMPPRMTTTQRNAIASPAAGMVIYNTSTSVLNFHNGSSWYAV